MTGKPSKSIHFRLPSEVSWEAFRRRGSQCLCDATVEKGLPDAVTRAHGGVITPGVPSFAQQVTSPDPYDGVIGKEWYNNVLIPSDQRKIVSNTTSAPYKSIVNITTAQGGAGTGTIVGPRHILTCAHTLWDNDTKKQATGVYVKVPGAMAPIQILDKNIFVYLPYTNRPPSEYFSQHIQDAKVDVAVLVATQTLATGTEANGGFFDVNYYSDPYTLQTLPLRLVGYPAVNAPCRASTSNTHLFEFPFGTCDGKLYETTSGKVVRADYAPYGVFQHNFDAAHGMSGAPIFQHFSDSKKSVVLGMHIFWDSFKGNFAHAITQTTRDWINAVIASK